MNLPLHTKFSGAEVEVIPLEGTDLAPAQPSGELQQKELEAAILFGLDQQTLDLLRGQHLHFPGLGGREAAAVRRVAEEELFRNRFVQRGMKGGVDAPDGLVGKTFAVELGPEEPTALLEPGIELLNVIGGQFVQLGLAQRRDDMLVDAPFVGHLVRFTLRTLSALRRRISSSVNS